MALIECRECRKAISDEASVCPYCGIKSSAPKQVGLVGAIVVIVLMLFAVKVCVTSPAPVPTSPTTPADLGASARYICKDFITRSGYNVPDFGEWSAWTTIDNKDGTWSVGARFIGAPPGGVTRNLYVTCVMSNSGDNWSLLRLSRLQ